MAAQDSHILWFRDLGHESRPLVGGKNASLGEMMRVGVRVPTGFALTTRAYDAFLEHAGLRPHIHAALGGLDHEDTDAVEEVSRRLRSLIEGATLPGSVEQELRDSYAALAAETLTTAPPVAVRSSATAEDLEGASFAGQQETFLWVRGPESLGHHALRCWSSLFTAEAITYRARMGFPPESVSISVGVQRMVDARVAGVMFTLNPINGDPSKIVIEASWGLGLSVVGGEVTPDDYWVDKVTLDVIKRSICQKAIKYVPHPGGSGVARVDVPADAQGTACLSDQEVVELARLGKALEGTYGSPRDIEWAIDDQLPFPDNVLMLQCRPETVWSQRAAAPLAAPQPARVDYVVGALLTKGSRSATKRPG
jgi:pyruvate, water dikinase